MAEGELTDEVKDELRAALLVLQAELTAALNASEDGAKPVDLEEPIGRLSRVDALQQQHMVTASRRSQQRRKQQVRAALALMDRGEYGICVACEEPIDLGRLRARPETPLCLPCQGAREQK